MRELMARIIFGLLLIIFAILFGSAEAGFDILGLNNQVQAQGQTIDQHQKTLDNHEARINNNEQDIKALEITPPPATKDKVEAPEPTPTTTTDTTTGNTTGNPQHQFYTGDEHGDTKQVITVN